MQNNCFPNSKRYSCSCHQTKPQLKISFCNWIRINLIPTLADGGLSFCQIKRTEENATHKLLNEGENIAMTPYIRSASLVHNSAHLTFQVQLSLLYVRLPDSGIGIVRNQMEMLMESSTTRHSYSNLESTSSKSPLFRFFQTFTYLLLFLPLLRRLLLCLLLRHSQHVNTHKITHAILSMRKMCLQVSTSKKEETATSSCLQIFVYHSYFWQAFFSFGNVGFCERNTQPPIHHSGQTNCWKRNNFGFKIPGNWTNWIK